MGANTRIGRASRMTPYKSIFGAFAIIVAASIVLSCSGNKVVAPAPNPAQGGRQLSTATFVIKIPSGSATSTHRGTNSIYRKPLYVSKSTQSMTVAVTGVSLQTFNLTPASPGCSSSTGTLVCSESVNAPAGNDTFTVITYDAQNGTGNQLSTGTIAQNITSGSNIVNIILGGIVASMTITPNLQTANFTLENADGSFTIVGPLPQPFLLNFLDADSNIIMGPGTPSAPNVTSQSVFTVSLNQAPGSQQFTATGLKLAGGPVTLSATLNGITANAKVFTTGALWVANAGSTPFVSAYAVSQVVGFATPPPAVQTTSPVGIIYGSNTGIHNPIAVQQGSDGTVYVLENTSGTILVFSPASVALIGGSSLATGNITPSAAFNSVAEGLAAPSSMFIATNGDLFVAFGHDSVTGQPGAIALYNHTQLAAVGGTAGHPQDLPPSLKIGGASTGLNNPQAVWVDSFINVVNQSAASITMYQGIPSGNVAPNGIIAGPNTALSTPLGISEDAAGNLYVSNRAPGSGTVAMFKAANVTSVRGGASGNITPVKITNGLSDPQALVITEADIVVPNFGNSTLSLYNAPAVGGDSPTSILQNGSVHFLFGPASAMVIPRK